MQENRCICCGAIIPEGTQVCPECRHKQEEEPDLDDWGLFLLQKEEERESMPIFLSFLIALGKFMLICTVWQVLERKFYGAVQPRIVDDIIGLILFFYILKGEIL